MSCFDGMVVDDLDDTLISKPDLPTAYLSRPMPLPSRPSFDTFTGLYPDPDMRRLSTSMNGLLGVPNTDSLSRSKGGELPVLEHLLSADEARTLSLGKLITHLHDMFSSV